MESNISLVGKILTDFFIGQEFPTNCISNFFGGEIIDRFFYRSRISPLVGRLLTDLKNGHEFPHWWGHSWPTWKTVNNFPTDGILYFFGGEIVDRLKNQSAISPLVGTLLTDLKNGQQFPHRWNPKFLWWGSYWPIFYRSTISPRMSLSLVSKFQTFSISGDILYCSP